MYLILYLWKERISDFDFYLELKSTFKHRYLHTLSATLARYKKKLICLTYMCFFFFMCFYIRLNFTVPLNVKSVKLYNLKQKITENNKSFNDIIYFALHTTLGCKKFAHVCFFIKSSRN